MNTPAIKNELTKLRNASRLVRNGQRSEALLIYNEIAGRADMDSALNLQLGQLCSDLDNILQAIEHYKTAVDQDPSDTNSLSYLGVAYQKAGQSDQAVAVFDRAMAIDAQIPAVLHGLGVAWMGRADYAKAKDYLVRALELKPSDAAVRANLATTLANLNEHEEGLKHAEKALKLDSANPYAHYAVGRILTELGRTDEAVRHFEKTIRQHKKFGGAYQLLAQAKKFSVRDQPFIDKTEKILEQGMPPEERVCVHFALGKMNDDCRNWDEAFEHYRQANLLQNRSYDLRSERTRFKKLKKVFDGAIQQRYQASGDPSEQPVFVVGMPRSGTTLIEQMIASHPRADGAGELPEIPRIANLLSPTEDMSRIAARTQANLTPDSIANFASDYLSVLQQGRKGADRIVDKLPGNYLYLGLITVLFPNATIIHVVRHPLDTCLSCYFQNFTNVAWTNDFKTIGETYLFYREVMEYWHGVLPRGRVLDVHYEKLVEDPETQGRRLLEACRLDWDARSLEFHEQRRVVKTASFWQVRQPIYGSSRSRWVNYAAHLGDLANNLSDFLEDDRQQLAEAGIRLSPASGVGWLKKLLS